MPAKGDLSLSNVALLLDGSALADSGPFGRTLTATGTVAVSTAQKKWGDSSIKFDGSGTTLQTAADTSLGLGTGDFTVEAWVNPIAVGANQQLLNSTTVGALFIRLGQWPSYANGIQLGRSGTANDNFTAFAFAVGTWYHVAVTRENGTVRVFVNGALLNTFAYAFDFGASSTALIGNTQAGAGGEALNAYIQDYRITKGLARYTAAFTPPAAQLPNYRDDGDASFGSTVLLLDGTSLTADTSPAGRTFTTAGNVALSPVTKYAATSITFDGSGDYLTTPAHADFAFGTGDFTIEWFSRKTANGSAGYDPVCANDNTGTSGGFLIDLSSSRGLAMYGAGGFMFGPVALDPNDSTWHHWAITRQGTTVRGFKDGALIGTSTSAANLACPEAFVVGGRTTAGFWFNGQIQGLRVTKGLARYTAAFTAPTGMFPALGPVQADPNWSSVILAANFDAGLVDKSPSKRTLTLMNAPVQSSLRSVFGGRALRMPANNAYVKCENPADFAFGSGDFTIEMFAYYESVATGPRPIYIGNGTTGVVQIYLLSSGIGVETNNGAGGVYGGSFPVNKWTHIALTRQAGTVRVFKDGALVGSYTNNVTLAVPSTVFLNQYGDGAQAGAVGWLDEVRVTKGVSRYNAAFTKPFAPNYIPQGGIVSGVIRDASGNPASRTVRVYDRASGSLLQQLVAGADGVYSVSTETLDEVQVVALDDAAAPLENDLVARVIPTEVT